LAAPTYNIPGQTTAPAAGGRSPDGGTAPGSAVHAAEPPPRTVAAVLFADRNRQFTPEDLTTLAEADIRGSRVFALAAAHPLPGGKE